MHHHPAHFLRHGSLLGSSSPSAGKNVLLILNNPREINLPLCRYLWRDCAYRVCVDGGANWLHDQDKSMVPDLVHGDLDSLREDVERYYRETRGVTVVRDPGQDNTDMAKCLDKTLARFREEECKKMTVYVLGAFGSRFDHEMGNLNTSLKYLTRFHRLVLLTESIWGEILTPDVTHELHPLLPETICGIVPLFGPVPSLTTTGLKWNLTAHPSHFGAMVSTSNLVVDETVTVRTEKVPIFWTSSWDGTRESFSTKRE